MRTINTADSPRSQETSTKSPAAVTKTVIEGRTEAAPDPTLVKVRARGKISEAQRERRAIEKRRKHHQGYVCRLPVCTTSRYCSDRGTIVAGDCKYDYRQQCLVLPLININGQLQSSLRIYDNGSKRFWKGLPVRGAFFPIGIRISWMLQNAGACDSMHILICEEFATGATLHESTKLPVICAMYSANLLLVSVALAKKFPSIKITVCGDDDRATPGNPGRSKATIAATTIGAKLKFPELCSGCSCTNWNDLANCQKHQVMKS